MMCQMRERTVMSNASNTVTNVLLILQIVILLSLIAFAPYAMTFGPYERIYTEGAYEAPHSEDPLYEQRALLIGFGLIGSIVCAGCGVAASVLNCRRHSRVVLHLSMVLCALAYGWRTYPYWVNGILEVYSGDLSMAVRYQFDPKPLMPMVWIGDIWRLGVLLFYPLIIAGGLCLLVLATVIAKKEGIAAWLWASLAVLAASVIPFLFSPGYIGWLMD